jgi:flagellin FlaB
MLWRVYTATGDDEAFTGLEAAIVLIAFVVVAAVFSYMVLGAGFNAAAQDVKSVHDGIGMSSTFLNLNGDMYAGVNSLFSPARVDSILIPVSINPTGDPVDFTKVNVICMTRDHYDELIPCDPIMNENPAVNHWGIKSVRNGNGNNFLESGEIFVLNLKLLNSLRAYEDFTVEIQPSECSVMTLRKEIPPGLESKSFVIL